jgi:ubiquinone biosynthesis protein
MKLSLKPRHLKRYKDIFLLVVKYSGADIARELDDPNILDEHEIPPQDRSRIRPEELADDLERMGPTFVKLGQLLSSRADLVPETYLKSLARLQDKVKPFPFQDVEKIVEHELNVRISKAFASFNPEPIAAASLGQVHSASLRDGRPVVVKVQRPNIRPQILDDFEVLQEMAEFFDNHTKIGRRYQFKNILEEFKNTLLNELDYRREAHNLKTLANNLKNFQRLHVPIPVEDYTTERVLTMDYVSGTKITKLSPLARLDIDGGALADELFQAYLKQVLVDGFFHADPHPGNVFLTDDGRIALLDLGMVGRTTPGMQEHLLKLLLALSEGNSEAALEIVLQISETRPHFNKPDFERRIGQLIVQQREATLQQIDLGKALLKVGRVSAETGVFVPTELTMLGKTLLQLDQIGRILWPDFNPNEAVQRHVSDLLTKKTWKNISPSNMLTPLLEAKDFLSALPRRLNKILDTVGNSEFHVQVKTPDTEHLMTAFQKIANRITTGLILSALIVGASLLMQINTPFTIFGYPGLAMLCFIIAGGGGLWLVASILLKDYKDRRRLRHRRGL